MGTVHEHTCARDGASRSKGRVSARHAVRAPTNGKQKCRESENLGLPVVKVADTAEAQPGGLAFWRLTGMGQGQLTNIMMSGLLGLPHHVACFARLERRGE